MHPAYIFHFTLHTSRSTHATKSKERPRSVFLGKKARVKLFDPGTLIDTLPAVLLAIHSHPQHRLHIHTMSRSQLPDDVVIVSALRTPLCRSRKGALAKVPPSTLVETVFQATLEKTRVAGGDIEDICMGNCLMPPAGFAAMRMAQIVAGIPPTAGLQMINRQCSSGLQAVAHIASAIQAGQLTIGIGGGVESMSFYPM
jgi:hypothetical protein